MTIQLKRSTTAAKWPAPADLEVGELAANVADGRLYTKIGSGAVREVGYGPINWNLIPSDLGSFTEGGAVSTSVAAASAFGTVTHAITAGSLPAGLSLNSGTGAIAGTMPTTHTQNTGYSFTVTATDSVGNSMARIFTITVAANNDAPTWSSPASFKTAHTSLQLSATDQESGTNLTYSVVSGTLPPGWSLSATGLLSAASNAKDGSVHSFTVAVSDGVNSVNRAFTMTLDQPTGSAVYTTPGTYSWTVPEGVTLVSAVAVGAGGEASTTSNSGGGGALAWKNNIAVTPGQSLSVVVGNYTTGNGQASTFAGMSAGGGIRSSTSRATFSGADGGGRGGLGGASAYCGAGGAGGYAATSPTGTEGDGGNGGATGVAGTAGAGGGGGGGGGGVGVPAGSSSAAGGGGGGVGLYGMGTNGSGGAAAQSSSYCGYGGGAGSGGTRGANGRDSHLNSLNQEPSIGESCGGSYGGGSTHEIYGQPGVGAVRIIWGSGRSFPSNAA